MRPRRSTPSGVSEDFPHARRRDARDAARARVRREPVRPSHPRLQGHAPWNEQLGQRPGDAEVDAGPRRQRLLRRRRAPRPPRRRHALRRLLPHLPEPVRGRQRLALDGPLQPGRVRDVDRAGTVRLLPVPPRPRLLRGASRALHDDADQRSGRHVAHAPGCAGAWAEAGGPEASRLRRGARRAPHRAPPHAEGGVLA